MNQKRDETIEYFFNLFEIMGLTLELSEFLLIALRRKPLKNYQYDINHMVIEGLYRYIEVLKILHDTEPCGYCGKSEDPEVMCQKCWNAMHQRKEVHTCINLIQTKDTGTVETES